MENEPAQNKLEFFKLLTNNSFDIISLVKTDGTIVFESNATERLLGYKSGKRNGKNVFDFVHPDDRDRAISIFKKQNGTKNSSIPFTKPF